MKYAALLSLLFLTACLTVEDRPGVTHKASIFQFDYAHIPGHDWCRGVGWMKSTEATVECRCFDDIGNVLPGCLAYEFDGKHRAEERRAAEQAKWQRDMERRRRDAAQAERKQYCSTNPADEVCQP